ncbi:peptidase inhibitor family I36 protein [Streptomyces zhihengii]
MHKGIRRALTALTGLVTAGLLTATLPAQTAQAASGAERCPKGYFCGFTGTSGDGEMFKTNKDLATLGAWDNRIRSLVNRAGNYACAYSEPNYDLSAEGADFLRESPNASSGEYGFTPFMDRRISSIRFVKTDRECWLNAYPRWWVDPAAAPAASATSTTTWSPTSSCATWPDGCGGCPATTPAGSSAAAGTP